MIQSIDNRAKTHNLYHLRTSAQYRIISEKNFTYYVLIKTLKKYLKSSQKAIDIGCGAGALTFYIAQNVHSILGIDISAKAIKECNRSKRYLQIDNSYFEVIDFPHKIPKGKFDLVILTEVIEHLDEPSLALKQIHKLLNKNGLLFLTTPSNQAPLHRWGLTKEFDKRVGHEQRFSLNELKSLLRKNGFSIKSISKNEGVLRNILYVNPYIGKLIRFIKGPLVKIYMILDDISVKIFGESQFILLAQKK